MTANAPVPAIRWNGEARTGSLTLIDQTRLPRELSLLECRDVETVWEAIKQLRVRGAPAIGVSAAYGVVLGCQTAVELSRAEFDARFQFVTNYLAESRPTAVNLFWAIDRVRRIHQAHAQLSSAALLNRLLEEAVAIEAEDRAMCAAIGEHGANLIHDGMGVLTHCNTGGLATAGDGTALAVLFTAAKQGKRLQVYADETRPLLQGARLTAWELLQRNVPCTLITDNMAGWVMKERRVQCAIVGADRITANGDTANKIGTYSVAHLAKAHGIPFYVAAPSSTFDLSLKTGEEIPIEQRTASEITTPYGLQIAPANCPVYNPAFDVTPASLITAIITEKGIISPVTEANIRRIVGSE